MNASERRQEAIRLDAEGVSRRQIAIRLGVSHRQVLRYLTPAAGRDAVGDAGVTDRTSEASDGPDVPGTTKPFRERLRDDLEARLYPRILELLEQAGKAKKRVWVSCPSCSKKSQVEIPDAKAALDVAQFYVDQGLGRAGVADDEVAAQPMVLVNKIIIPCGHEECADGFESGEHTTIVLGADIEVEDLQV